MVIKNAVVLNDSFKFEKLDIRIENEYIAEIGKTLSHENEIDAKDCYLVPGFIDIHTHGCVGHDTCDANIEGYDKMSEFYASKGVTSFLFTTMSFSEEILGNILCKIDKYMNTNHVSTNKDTPKAYSHGIYLEGPFINTSKKGAQAEKYIMSPDINMYRRLSKVSGNRIKVVAMAPELKGSMEFIEQVSKECAISVAHTAADYNTAIEAFKRGASGVTHLFNAMSGYNHREPGVVGAAFDSNAFMEIICDGVHLHQSIIRNIFKIGLDDRIILVSDSLSAAGMCDGQYLLGGQEVTLREGKATLSDGTLAGSSCNVFDCVKNCISIGILEEDAIKAATINPARLIGADKITGSITVGKYADLVLLDSNMNIQKVWIKGNR